MTKVDSPLPPFYSVWYQQDTLTFVLQEKISQISSKAFLWLNIFLVSCVGRLDLWVSFGIEAASPENSPVHPLIMYTKTTWCTKDTERTYKSLLLNKSSRSRRHSFDHSFTVWLDSDSGPINKWWEIPVVQPTGHVDPLVKTSWCK